MATCSTPTEAVVKGEAKGESRPAQAPPRRAEIKASLFTGGFDRPYAFGMVMSLAAQGIPLDVIGSTDIDGQEMHTTLGVNFLNLHGDLPQVGLARRLARVLGFYLRLFRYVTTTRTRMFHILWNNKAQYFDRTLLMLFYKLLGKKIVLTAHNVNAGKRDGNDSALNRLTLRAQYHLVDHILLHTALMKRQLIEEFGVNSEKVTVIPFGINNSVPNTALTREEAKEYFALGPEAKTILFFGSIRPYKGLERLVPAFLQLAERGPEYRLMVAGQVRKGCEGYLENIRRESEQHRCHRQVIWKTEFVPDPDTELYFKAADLVVLPYVEIFQSGVMFLAFSFGVPVVAGDIGSFGDDVVQGENGFLYDPSNPNGLFAAMERYFDSNLYRELDLRRDEIRERAERAHSWQTVGMTIRNLYERLLPASEKAV
jgi:glycosyltransferase involved in cell wall biosynthesis